MIERSGRDRERDRERKRKKREKEVGLERISSLALSFLRIIEAEMGEGEIEGER